MTTFLSYHHHADADAAAALVAALQKAGVAVFQDVKDLRSGDRWMTRLQQKLDECSAFVVLVGRDGIARWVAGEVEVALNLHFGPHDDAQRLTLHPLLLPGAGPDSLPPFLALFQAVRWVPGEPLPQGLVRALRERGQRDNTELLIEPGRCPYMGLASFGIDDAQLFFGRREESLTALRSLGDASDGDPDRPRAIGATHIRWLQVEGHSGSGKSSLVKAGLLPMLRQGGALWARTGFAHVHVLGPILPSAKPVERLAEALEHGLTEDPNRRDTLARAVNLDRDSRALALHLRDRRRPETAFVLLVDQFEELFTLAEEGQRNSFDALLATALEDDDCPLYLVSTVRSDFLDRMTLLPELNRTLNTRARRLLLPTIGPEGLRDAILGPAKLAGLDVSEVTDALLAEVQHEPGALPLVENALTQLWRERQGSRLSGRVLTERGGAAGLLSSGADALLGRVAAEQGKIGRKGALELLLRLTRVNRDDRLRHSRRRVGRDEAAEVAGMGDPTRGEKVLAILSGQSTAGRPSGANAGHLRLVTTGSDRTVDGEQRWVDLIHETLLRARPPLAPDAPVRPYWETLYDYIEQHRDRDALRPQFELQVERWQASGRLTRWTHLAGWAQWRAWRHLRPARRSASARYLRNSMGWLATQVTLLLVVLGGVGHGAWWAASNNLPLGYALYEPLWMLGWTPQPEAVPLPPPPSGRFTMGCKRGRDVETTEPCEDLGNLVMSRGIFGLEREVTLPQPPCAMARYPVTFVQYDRFVWSQRGKRAYPVDAGWGRFDRPAINVSWRDAQAYAAWLSTATGQSWRLPTDAEWEYAARGGIEARFPWGDGPPAGKANCSHCGDHPPRRTTPVDQYPPNGFGLHDMAGNVWQWVGEEKNSDNLSVYTLRGGSWQVNSYSLRAAIRKHSGTGGDDVGFRVCRVAPIENLPISAREAGSQKR